MSELNDQRLRTRVRNDLLHPQDRGLVAAVIIVIVVDCLIIFMVGFLA